MMTNTPTRGRGPIASMIGLVALAGTNLTYLLLRFRYLDAAEPTTLAAFLVGFIPLVALFGAVAVWGRRVLPSPSPPGSRTPPEGSHCLPVAVPMFSDALTPDVLAGLVLGTTAATDNRAGEPSQAAIDLSRQLAVVRS